MQYIAVPVVIVLVLGLGGAQRSDAEALSNVQKEVKLDSLEGSRHDIPAIEIDFCQLHPRFQIMATKTDFTAVLSFEVGSDGSPRNLVDHTHITREDALRWGWPEEWIAPTTPTSKWQLWEQDESFSWQCISSWKLRGIPIGTKINAEFKWVHAISWESLHIMGEGVNYIIKASGRTR
jgi:hypothetical protein